MNVVALQKKLLKQIAEINDVSVLKKIDQIVKTDSKIYVLNDFQLQHLKNADLDLKNGNFIDGDEMDKKVKKWLSEKSRLVIHSK